MERSNEDSREDNGDDSGDDSVQQRGDKKISKLTHVDCTARSTN